MTTAKDLITKTFLKIDLSSTVAQLLGKFSTTETHTALVYDGNTYLGVIEKRFLVERRIDPAIMKVGNAIKKRSKAKTPFYVPTLTEDTDIKDICKLMSTSDSHVLPVLKDKKVIGIVRAFDVALAIAQEYKGITCDKLGSMKPITASPQDSIDQVLTLLSKHSIDHLPLVNPDKTIAGIVSLSDLIHNAEFWRTESQHLPRAASHQGKPSGYGKGEKTSLLDLPIHNFMGAKTLCCTKPETPVSTAVQNMAQSGTCSIILVRENKPVGIMTLRDLLLDYSKAR